jgi:hypothetical protein
VAQGFGPARQGLDLGLIQFAAQGGQVKVHLQPLSCGGYLSHKEQISAAPNNMARPNSQRASDASRCALATTWP